MVLMIIEYEWLLEVEAVRMRADSSRMAAEGNGVDCRGCHWTVDTAVTGEQEGA